MHLDFFFFKSLDDANGQSWSRVMGYLEMKRPAETGPYITGKAPPNHKNPHVIERPSTKVLKSQAVLE